MRSLSEQILPQASRLPQNDGFFMICGAILSVVFEWTDSLESVDEFDDVIV